MRSLTTTICFMLFALSLTLLAASHFLSSRIEMHQEYPTSREWQEHRHQAEELEKKMQECKDPIELEKLCRQHAELIEQWKHRTQRPPAKEQGRMQED